jgi:hypothetical protein
LLKCHVSSRYTVVLSPDSAATKHLVLHVFEPEVSLLLQPPLSGHLDVHGFEPLRGQHALIYQLLPQVPAPAQGAEGLGLGI